MGRVRGSGVVRWRWSEAGGTKCDASVGCSGSRSGCWRWGSVGLAGWLVGCQAGLMRQGLESEGLQLQASVAMTAKESGV